MAERNAHAETRRIAYNLAQRVPELEPPRGEPYAPEAVSEETGEAVGADHYLGRKGLDAPRQVIFNR